MRRSIAPAELIDGLLAGNRLALARAISRVENEDDGARVILDGVFAQTGRGHLIGVTGAPGTGKSTLVNALARAFRGQGETVAILAVDPTSPFTGGALLGDRVRMTQLSGDPGVFIRSMATRGHLGGLAAASVDVLQLLDSAGFDRILIETVGVGQAEVEIAATAHTTLVVEAPGLGDEVQAIKAGVLEIADIFVVNKADRPGVERTVTALEMMLEQRRGGVRSMRHHGQVMSVALPPTTTAAQEWTIPVLKTVAVEAGGMAKGVDALRQAIEGHRSWLVEGDGMALREESRIARTLETLIQTALSRRMQATLPAEQIAAFIGAVRRRELSPHAAADAVVRQLTG
ncbi:methylmalonyl Co-A mutase-associated GTPase MeaB [bacterium]|nr:methylmalonyl Co-A mutase-associated GTPase MeaB [bacterium]